MRLWFVISRPLHTKFFSVCFFFLIRHQIKVMHRNLVQEVWVTLMLLLLIVCLIIVSLCKTDNKTKLINKLLFCLSPAELLLCLSPHFVCMLHLVLRLLKFWTIKLHSALSLIIAHVFIALNGLPSLHRGKFQEAHCFHIFELLFLAGPLSTSALFLCLVADVWWCHIFFFTAYWLKNSLRGLDGSVKSWIIKPAPKTLMTFEGFGVGL